MGKVVIAIGGGGAVSSDDLTVTSAYVHPDYTYLGADTDDEIGTGTMATKAAATYYATTSDQTIAANQYLNGAQKISKLSATNFSAANIKGGTTISVNNGNANVYSVTGTFTSDATATAAYIYKDKTAYANGSKVTGTMTVSSVLSFSVAAYSTTQLLCTWKNPAQASGRPFSGVIICCKTGSYPTSPTDGFKYMGSGGNSTAQGTGSVTISGLTAGTTYYLRCWSYCICSAGNYTVNNTKVLTNGYLSATGTTTASGRKAFTSSGTWTVPENVRTINIHCTGGGGAGRNYRSSDYYGGGGGGGGYTTYQTGISVVPGNVVTYTVGAGGTKSATSATSSEKTGGDTIVKINNTANTSLTAEGGYTAGYMHALHGGSGGSGGGFGADFTSNSISSPTNGYSDGGGNNGQGTTTREFGLSTGTLYSGGGGGGGGNRYRSGSESYYQYAGTAGGSGGGGNGAGDNGTTSGDSIFPSLVAGSAGSAGTGGGGGGGAYANSYTAGYNGGSGNVIITW